MTQRFETVVVGGGILGWSAAYRLVRRGARVAVIDNQLDGRATAAGAGIVSPGTSIHGHPGTAPLTKAAVAWYPTLIAELAEDGETDTGFSTPGTLFVFTNDEEYDRMPEVRSNAEKKLADGVRCIDDISLLSGPEAKDLFPALADIPGALYMSGGSRVDGRLITAAMRRAAIARGAVEICGEAAIDLDSLGQRSIKVNEETVQFDNLLIAAGAWTRDLMARLGLDIPLAPQRGQILHLSMPDVITTNWPVIHGFHNHYLLAFAENRVVAGATREDDTGFDYRMTLAGVAQEMNEALRVAPGLAHATLTEIRVGFRPMSADGLPIMGRIPQLDNVHIATGHGPGGLTMGPFSGAIVADSILDGEPDPLVQHYSIDRFGKAYESSQNVIPAGTTGATFE
jgi:D-amino-acid dehydrogenase